MPDTTVHEIADGVFRLSTCIPDVAPGGFTFNQFLITGDEPALYHTGMRGLYPLVSAAVARVVPVESLRWISFGHVESDECGAVNLFLEAAPASAVVFNPLGCDVSLNDMCDRPPEPSADGTRYDTGGHVLSIHATPHVPHGWEAQVLFDETTRTLFCGDLLSHVGDGPAILHAGDIVGAAMEAEDIFGATGIGPATAPTIRRLAALEPRTLAIMHGSSYAGDCVRALHDLADAYESRVSAALEPAGA